MNGQNKYWKAVFKATVFSTLLLTSSWAQREGDRQPLETVNPRFDLVSLRPNNFTPKVSGMRWLSEDTLLILDWNGDHNLVHNLQFGGRLYKITNLENEQPNIQLFAEGLTDPLGLEVVDGKIFVCGGETLYEVLPDDNGDGKSEGVRVIKDFNHPTHGRHEFFFGLLYEAPYFYGALSASKEGTVSIDQINPGRGAFYKIHEETGEAEVMSAGLRTPNGLNWGPEGEMFNADNQGAWLPSSKLMHIKKDEFNFYGHRQEIAANNWTPQEVARLEEWKSHEDTPPAVWFPQGLIGLSPTEPLLIPHGIFKNQMYIGDVAYGGIQRVYLEKVKGEFQGGVVRSIGGLEAGINRMIWGPDSALYIGGTGEGDQNNWGWRGFKTAFQKLVPTNEETFEIKAVYSKPNGMTIEFTHPVNNAANNASSYVAQAWTFAPNEQYGGGNKVGTYNLQINNVSVSDDRKLVYLEIGNFRLNHCVYIRVNGVNSGDGKQLWSTETWYTLNALGEGEPFEVDNGIEEEVSVKGERVSQNFNIRSVVGGWEMQFDSQQEKAEVSLFHLNGEKIKEYSFNAASQTQVLAPELQKGVYFLKVKTDVGTFSQAVRKL